VRLRAKRGERGGGGGARGSGRGWRTRRACRLTRERLPKEKRCWNGRKGGNPQMTTTAAMTMMSMTSALGSRMEGGRMASRGPDPPTPSRSERAKESRSPSCLQILPPSPRMDTRTDACVIACKYSVTLQPMGILPLSTGRRERREHKVYIRLLSRSLPDFLAWHSHYVRCTTTHDVCFIGAAHDSASSSQELRGLLKLCTRLHEPLSIGRTTNGLCPSAGEFLHARCGDPPAQTPPCPCSDVSFALGPRSFVGSRTVGCCLPPLPLPPTAPSFGVDATP
jgi:hypothetical protein